MNPGYLPVAELHARACEQSIPPDKVWRLWNPRPISKTETIWRIQKPDGSPGFYASPGVPGILATPTSRRAAHYAGYMSEALGVEVQWPPTEHAPWPFFRMRNDQTSEVITIQKWYEWGGREDHAIFAEMRWRPGYSSPVWLAGGFSRLPDRAQLTAASRAIRFLQLANEHPGRPEGSKEKYKDPESYISAIRELPERARRSGWNLRTASKSRIAKWLRIDSKTFDARNNDHGVTIEDIREQRV